MVALFKEAGSGNSNFQLPPDGCFNPVDSSVQIFQVNIIVWSQETSFNRLSAASARS